MPLFGCPDSLTMGAGSQPNIALLSVGIYKGAVFITRLLDLLKETAAKSIGPCVTYVVELVVEDEGAARYTLRGAEVWPGDQAQGEEAIGEFVRNTAETLYCLDSFMRSRDPYKPSSTIICSRIANFWTLPVTVEGKLSTKRT